jgi:hypothetical protein
MNCPLCTKKLLISSSFLRDNVATNILICNPKNKLYNFSHFYYRDSDSYPESIYSVVHNNYIIDVNVEEIHKYEFRVMVSSVWETFLDYYTDKPPIFNSEEELKKFVDKVLLIK